MYDESLNAAKKLSKGRSQLVMDDPFFGSQSMRMIIRPDTQNILIDKTIATNGVDIVYNVDYIDSLSVPETKAEIAHEMGHIAFKHHLRRGKREPRLWNIACDQVIDSILNECPHIRLTQKWVDNINPKFKDMSAEEVYAIMKTAQSSGNTSQKSSPPGKSVSQSPPLPGAGGGTPSPQPGKQPPSPAGGAGAPPITPPAPQPGSQKCGFPSIKAQNPPPIPKMPGAHGLILDSPIDLKDKKEVQKAEEDIDVANEVASKLCGDLPGGLSKLVSTTKKHQIHYTAFLRDFLETTIGMGDYSWMTPDRAYTHMGIYVPGIDTEEELPQIVFACDSSGSIGDEEKQIFAQEISGVLEEFPCTIKAIYCDTRVANVQDIDADNFPIELEFKGGGGTCFSPVFEYIEKHGLEPKAVLYFTDLCSSDFGEDPKIPVLWMNTERSNDKKEIPFGKIIKLELKNENI